jgi:hypothetical protein
MYHPLVPGVTGWRSPLIGLSPIVDCANPILSSGGVLTNAAPNRLQSVLKLPLCRSDPYHLLMLKLTKRGSGCVVAYPEVIFCSTAPAKRESRSVSRFALNRQCAHRHRISTEYGGFTAVTAQLLELWLRGSVRIDQQACQDGLDKSP